MQHILGLFNAPMCDIIKKIEIDLNYEINL